MKPTPSASSPSTASLPPEDPSFPRRKHPFSVFQASAGAGKTYRLVYEYIDLVLRGRMPGSILAMTFTNKAAGEMRERILAVLEDLAQAPEAWGKWGSIGTRLSAERGWEPVDVQRRAQEALKKTLHDYGSVSIQTLDKFALRLVKTFRYDLHVPDGFAVELNEKSLQQEAVQRVLDRVGIDPELTSLLESFVRANLEDAKSWDTTRTLETVSEHLSKESSRPHWEALADVPLADVQAWAELLRREAAAADAAAQAAAADGYRRLVAAGVPEEEYSYQYLPKWLRSTAQEGFVNAPNATIQKMLNGEAPWLKDSKKKNAANELLLEEQGVKAGVTQAVRKAEEAYLEGLRPRFLVKHAYATGVLQALAVAYEAVCLERGVQPLSKFNSLIYKELVEKNGEYLLERLGARFRHYFIDEAQDTSRVQWENLYPLLDHALSGQEYGNSGTALVVGDGKQSIYRWRNSEAEQFLETASRAAENQPPRRTLPAWAGRTERLLLSENWRSRQEIVRWNNTYFAEAGSRLEDELHRSAYAQNAVEQAPRGAEGGFVQLRPAVCKLAADRQALILDELVEQLRSYTAAGWAWKDLAVLVRNNKQGAAVVERLVEAGIPVFSADSLLLEQSAQVRFWMAALAAAHRPQSRMARTLLAVQAGKSGAWNTAPAPASAHDVELAAADERGFWTLWRERFPQWDNARLRTEGLYAAAESVVRWTELTPDAYGLAWLSAVLRFAQNNTNAWDAFQTAWESELSKKSIALPEGQDAAVVMTVHKSKGLEFECVFVPFAKESSGGFGGPPPVWMTSEGDWAGDPPPVPSALVPLEHSKFRSWISTVPVLRDALELRQRQDAFDALNVWYVAFTRPKSALVVWVPFTAPDKPDGDLAKDLVRFAQESGKGPEGPWTWGSFPTPGGVSRGAEDAGAEADGALTSMVFSAWTDRVRVLPERDDSSTSARWLGEQFHRVMQDVRTAADVSAAVARATENEADAAVLRTWAEGVVVHPDAAPWFAAEAEVLNERAVLAPGAPVLRPDRAVRVGNSWAVMDYKTGKPKPAHRDQVDGYAERLEAALGQPVKRLLVYLRRESIPEVHVW